jgi:hypothetical protein
MSKVGDSQIPSFRELNFIRDSCLYLMAPMFPTMRPQNNELIIMEQPEDPQYAKKNGIIFVDSYNGSNMMPNNSNSNNNSQTKNVFLQYATYKTARMIPVPEPLNYYLAAFYEKIRPWYFLKKGRVILC